MTTIKYVDNQLSICHSKTIIQLSAKSSSTLVIRHRMRHYKISFVSLILIGLLCLFLIYHRDTVVWLHGECEPELVSGSSALWSVMCRTKDVLIGNNKLASRIKKEDSLFAESVNITCDDECIRFRQLLVSWPDDRPIAAIYYLSHSARLHILKTSLSSVEKHFNLRYRYPIVIFHENDTKMHAARQSIRSHVSAPVFFQTVLFEQPSFINSARYSSCPSTMGYRHMCRFHAREVYHQPILCGLEYAWRLDDDSTLQCNVQYDVFSYMREHELIYGYRTIVNDWENCIVRLWPATKEYIKNNSIVPEFFETWTFNKVYWNNFEVSAMSLWRSPAYQDYVDYLDSLGGIYYCGWGDAPIKTLAVSVFVPQNKTYWFLNVPYKHKNFDSN